MQQKYKNDKISSYSIILTVLTILNAENYSTALSGLIVIIALSTLKKPEKLMPTFFLTSLASDYFVAFPGIGFARVFSVIFILSFIRNNPRLVVNKKWGLQLFLIVTATVVTFLDSNSRNINALMSFALNIAIFIVFANQKYSKEEIFNILKNTLASVVIMVVFGGIQLVINPNFMLNGRLSIDEGLNENRFAMMFGQLAAYLIGFIFLVERKKKKLLLLLLSCISLYLIILSGSRSSFVGILLGTVASIMLLFVKDKKRRRILFILPIIAVGGYLLFDYVITSNPLLAYRFNVDQVVSSGGTRRWPRAVVELEQVIPNNLLFGVGLTAENEYIETAKYMADPGSSHNIIISMLTQVGLFGFIAYMTFYLRIIKDLISSLRNNSYILIPILLIFTAIFNGIGEVVYNDRLFWSAISLGALSLTGRKDVEIDL